MPHLVKSASEFYNHEEAIAKNLTKEQILRETGAAIQAYNQIIDGHVDSDAPFTKAEQLKLQALVVKLRGLNRRSNLRTKLHSDLVDNKRKEVEKKHLTLQNLEMEIDHLQRSIDDLKALESTELDLVPVDEFLQRRGMSQEEFSKMNEHEQQMALMSLELELRKEFVQQIEELRSQMMTKEAELEEKEKKMDGILPQINQVRKLMQPVLQALDLHSVTPPYLERTTRSHYLPPQLSILYINVTVYNKINSNSLKYTCSGSVDEAIAFEKAHEAENNLKKQKIAEKEEALPSEGEEDEEEDELMDVDMPDSRTFREKEEEILAHFKQKQKLFQSHPISFTVEIPGESKGNLCFYYLPELDVVTLKSMLKLKPTYEPFLDAETVLDELYLEDDGLEHPNPSAAMLQSLAGTKLSEIVKTLGRPYKFVQQMCLVPNERESDESKNDRFKFFLRTILRIGERIKSRSILDVTYRNAAAEKPLDTLPEGMKRMIPQRDVCKLGKLNPIKPEDITSASLLKRQRAIIERLSETGQLDNGFQFICTVDQHGSTKIYAIFHVPRTYPDQSSIVLLVPTDHEKFEYSAALEALELYLNTDIPKLAEKEPELMFALQLGVLATRCEVVQDISQHDTEEGYKPANFYFNFHKSRLNEPIFDFVPNRNAYGRNRP